ncbi:hypothetical protein ACFC1R_21260 [Kitasatospora sp. NPDC056138]|uniref:hypothetical protein n=1 Tax=Kitasatospora sp. NPDC056138 TaxID=3345724 RepID=UPI0035E1514E
MNPSDPGRTGSRGLALAALCATPGRAATFLVLGDAPAKATAAATAWHRARLAPRPSSSRDRLAPRPPGTGRP